MYLCYKVCPGKVSLMTFEQRCVGSKGGGCVAVWGNIKSRGSSKCKGSEVYLAGLGNSKEVNSTEV